jgi:hypothetical protein
MRAIGVFEDVEHDTIRRGQSPAGLRPSRDELNGVSIAETAPDKLYRRLTISLLQTSGLQDWSIPGEMFSSHRQHGVGAN